jgi:hypothetical protein
MKILRVLALICVLAGVAVYFIGPSMITFSLSGISNNVVWNVNIHNVTAKIEMTISTDLYNYYNNKELGNGEMHLRNPLNGQDSFVFSSIAPSQTFVSNLVFVVKSAMAVRGWQVSIVFTPSQLIVETYTFGTSIFSGEQNNMPLSNALNDQGYLTLADLGYVSTMWINPGTYVLATVTWRVINANARGTVTFGTGPVRSIVISDPENGTELRNMRFYDATYQFGYGENLGPNNLASYPLFVTPTVFQTFATALKQIYPDDEDYTNVILQMVWKMTYAEAGPHYPVIPLARGYGDCDTFSLVVASLLKAAGIKCALIAYPGHMNLGVVLSHTPHDCVRSTPFSFTYNGVTYWMAECTGQGGTLGWRVGEKPTDLSSPYETFKPLDSVDTSSPPYSLGFALNGVQGGSEITPSPPQFAIPSWTMMLGLFALGAFFFIES